MKKYEEEKENGEVEEEKIITWVSKRYNPGIPRPTFPTRRQNRTPIL
jgi:hypothetical protein